MGLLITNYLNKYFEDIDLRNIFKSIIGTDDVNSISLLLENCIREHCNSSIQQVKFIQSSIGVVFGFTLANHNNIVLKVYSPKIPLAYLHRMNHIQKIFYQELFPIPHVLSDIFKFSNTHAGFYSLIDGSVEDAHQEPMRSELARHLAQFSMIVDKYNLEPLENIFQQAAFGKLWPIPHNVLFNLKKSTRGAGWIAEIARKSKKILTSAKLKNKLAHTDWGTKNSLFCNGKLVGILDWDSLGSMSELEMLGRAAAQFTADWESGFKITPTPEEGRLFVQCYEEYRKIKFTHDEYKIISSASDYHIAIISRFEHAGDNPSNAPFQDLLKSCEKKSFLLA